MFALCEKNEFFRKKYASALFNSEVLCYNKDVFLCAVAGGRKKRASFRLLNLSFSARLPMRNGVFENHAEHDDNRNQACSTDKAADCKGTQSPAAGGCLHGERTGQRACGRGQRKNHRDCQPHRIHDAVRRCLLRGDAALPSPLQTKRLRS